MSIDQTWFGDAGSVSGIVFKNIALQNTTLKPLNSANVPGGIYRVRPTKPVALAPAAPSPYRVLTDADIARNRAQIYGLRPGIRALLPGPLYHSAPMGMTVGVQAAGGTATTEEEAVTAANATFSQAHSTDQETAMQWAMDLTPLAQDDSIDPLAYTLGFIDRLKADVTARIRKSL